MYAMRLAQCIHFHASRNSKEPQVSARSFETTYSSPKQSYHCSQDPQESVHSFETKYSVHNSHTTQVMSCKVVHARLSECIVLYDSRSCNSCREQQTGISDNTSAGSPQHCQLRYRVKSPRILILEVMFKRRSAT